MEMTELRNAAGLNWSAIDVSIFGTLFERGLDPGKRSQLGAHYTDPATIERIVEPVLKRPLLQVWEQLVPVLQAHLAKSTRKGDINYKAAQVKFIGWLDQLKDFRVLDPACGSGNFLFMGLKALKDIELQSHIEAATLGLEREADLVTTNSIRGGKNRAVLDAIAKTTRIYEAWSDEGWVNNGAAVRVSLVSFGHAAQPAVLNGQPAEIIHADLSAGNADGTLVDLTTARRLAENVETCFEGIKKYGAFDVPGKTARMWLRSGGNPNQLPNFDVLHPWINATDVVRHNSDNWVIDFTGLAEDTASLYENPFEFARLIVLPERAKDRNKKTCEQWWLYERARTEMRNATTELSRFIVTPVVDWHRIFAWRQPPTLAMNLLDVVARADDTTFGILHSPHHELWSLRMGNSLEDRPSYTPTRAIAFNPESEGPGVIPCNR